MRALEPIRRRPAHTLTALAVVAAFALHMAATAGGLAEHRHAGGEHFHVHLEDALPGLFHARAVVSVHAHQHPHRDARPPVDRDHPGIACAALDPLHAHAFHVLSGAPPCPATLPGVEPLGAARAVGRASRPAGRARRSAQPRAPPSPVTAL